MGWFSNLFGNEEKSRKAETSDEDPRDVEQEVSYSHKIITRPYEEYKVTVGDDTYYDVSDIRREGDIIELLREPEFLLEQFHSNKYYRIVHDAYDETIYLKLDDDAVEVSTWAEYTLVVHAEIRTVYNRGKNSTYVDNVSKMRIFEDYDEDLYVEEYVDEQYRNS